MLIDAHPQAGGHVITECHRPQLKRHIPNGRHDQADTINQAFSPSDHEIAEAHKMLDVPIDGPHDGSYLPRYLRAKNVKELAKVYWLWGKTESDAQRANV